MYAGLLLQFLHQMSCVLNVWQDLLPWATVLDHFQEKPSLHVPKLSELCIQTKYIKLLIKENLLIAPQLENE